jgi:hypothetical protein
MVIYFYIMTFTYNIHMNGTTLCSLLRYLHGQTIQVGHSPLPCSLSAMEFAEMSWGPSLGHIKELFDRLSEKSVGQS